MNAFSRLSILPLLAFAAALSSCKMPPRQAWAEIQREGLVSYMGGSPMERQMERSSGLSEGEGTQFLDNFAWLDPIEGLQTRSPRSAIVLRRVQTAAPVPGRSGFVYSPHAAGKMVNVERFNAGDEVRCPHTGRPFYVPEFASSRSIAGLGESTEAPTVRLRSRTEPEDSPAVVVTPGEPERRPAPQAQPPKPDGLMASRVPGRDHQVYSPYAGRRQLVDVTGLKPGEKARCPYTNRIFVVPPAAGIAMRDQAGEKVAEITDGVDFRVLPDEAGGKPAVEAAGEKAKPPVARWSAQEGFVISPFGVQLVDVTGKAAGSTVRCPFSGKLFRVPAKPNE